MRRGDQAGKGEEIPEELIKEAGRGVLEKAFPGLCAVLREIG